jgi:putative tryptophan/tyrosine transport system substrate-binding protein
MQRREFIAGLVGAAAWPLLVRAQQPDRIKRVGILNDGLGEDLGLGNEAFLEGLAQLGWTVGRNLQVDDRSADSNEPSAMGPPAEALVRAAPDVIYARPATAVQALQRLTHTIPIVFVQSGDPVQGGSVQSLARPGSNMTGFVVFEPSINTKYLQLLKEIAPQVTRVSVLQTQASSWRGDFTVIELVARSFAVAPVRTLVRDDPANIERAIVAFAREPNGGLILPPDGITSKHRALIVALAATHRLPAVYPARSFADVGGLVSYAAARIDIRQVAAYVARILRGAKPADLPVQQPTKYETVINLNTAKALGLAIPETLPATADEVIQ